MSSTTYACLVTPENVDHIISFVKDHGLNIDYLKDNLEYAADDGYELYTILSFGNETGSKTSTEMSKDGFFDYWRFVNEENTKSPWFQLIDKK